MRVSEMCRSAFYTTHARFSRTSATDISQAATHTGSVPTLACMPNFTRRCIVVAKD